MFLVSSLAYTEVNLGNNGQASARASHVCTELILNPPLPSLPFHPFLWSSLSFLDLKTQSGVSCSA